MIRLLNVIKGSYLNNLGSCYGLCAAVDLLRANGAVTKEESYNFFSLLRREKGHQRNFYTFSGSRVVGMTRDSSQYIWHPYDIDGRVEWLDEQIELHS